MRFPQLRIGQRFTYQGNRYTKSGPLTASEEGSGKQRMIMRAAEVTLLESTADDPVKTSKQRFKRAEVDQLLKGFREVLDERVRALADEEGNLRLKQVLQLIEGTGFDY